MCLSLYGNQEPEIANEDIICYKHLITKTVVNKKLHGKPFTGVINNVDVEGVIFIENDCMYFLTNNPVLDGTTPITLDYVSYGYKYSWCDDPNVKSIVVDGKTLEKYMLTPYRKAIVKIGETYTSKLEKESNTISRGLHTFKYECNAVDDARVRVFHATIVKCIIPKGAVYYTGQFGGCVSYASNKLKYVEQVN